MIGPCQLCARETFLTRHHLVPQCRHHNKWNKKNFDRRAIKTGLLLLCSGCHRHLHALFTEKELERRLHDLPSLRAHPQVDKFVAWLRTKPPGFKPPPSRVATARLARAERAADGGFALVFAMGTGHDGGTCTPIRRARRRMARTRGCNRS